MMYYLGLDLGSSYTKGVIVDQKKRLVDKLAVRTAYSFKEATKKILDNFSPKYRFHYPVYSCGYGREKLEIPFESCSEITALARAIFEEYGRRAVIIDIGGQDTKYIRIDGEGRIESFRMNRKCAAGTGSFIEEIAVRLDIPTDEFSDLAARATEVLRLNSFCTVFAVTEIIGMIKEGVELPNIVLAIYNSVVDRCMEMADREKDVVLTGGIPYKHPTITELMRRKIPGTKSPELCQFMAAYGAVLKNLD